MKTNNRSVLLVTPKKSYIDWANSFSDDGPKMSTDQPPSTAILIPDTYDEYNYEKLAQKEL